MKIELALHEIIAALGLLLTPSPIAKLKGILRSKSQGETKMSGIKETEEVVQLLVAVVAAIKQAKSDGKIDLADAGSLLPLIQKIGPALSGVNQIGSELKDLDADEIKKLAGDALSLIGDSGKVHLYVEEGFNILASIYRIMKA